jgi:hypothetical protein
MLLFTKTLLPVLVALSLGLAAWTNPADSTPRAEPAIEPAADSQGTPEPRALFVETLVVVGRRPSGTTR